MKHQISIIAKCKVLFSILTITLFIFSVLPQCPSSIYGSSQETVIQTEVFSDIKGHAAEDVILKWYNSGVVCGYPDGTFCPDAPITRAELAKIITTAFDLQATDDESGYTDIVQDSWYFEYISPSKKYIPNYCPPDINEATFIYQNNGKRDSFFPDSPALRIHIAETFSLLKIEHESIDIQIPDILDIHKTVNERFNDGAYYSLNVLHSIVANNVRSFHTYTWLSSELGIMNGDDDGYFRPYETMTRAEALTILDKLLPQ